MDLGISISFFCTMYGLEKLGLVDQFVRFVAENAGRG